MIKNILVEGAYPARKPRESAPRTAPDWARGRRSSSYCCCHSDCGGPSGARSPLWFSA